MNLSKLALRDFVAPVCAVEPFRDPKQLLIQLKGLSDRKFLQPIPEIYGRRGALLFDESEAYRALTLVTALELGILSDELRDVNRYLGSSPFDFANAASALTDGLQIQIEFARIRDLDDGRVLNSACWIVDGQYTNSLRSNPLSTESFSLGGPILGVTYLKFSELCRPLFDEFRRKEVAAV